MKKLLSLAVAATAIAATPAAAQDATNFTGARVGVNVGLAGDDFFDLEEFVYGAEVGYDVNAGNLVVGFTGEINDAEDISRELAALVRVGGRVGSNGLIYVNGGYTNLRVFGINLDGVRLGVGGELAVAPNAYVKLEQSYSDYELGAKLWATRIGAGFRF